jgi:hypothetical protein
MRPGIILFLFLKNNDSLNLLYISNIDLKYVLIDYLVVNRYYFRFAETSIIPFSTFRSTSPSLLM